MTIALDWDGTLVDTKTQEWLPGALDALRWLRRSKHRIIIHSARASSQYGREQIEGKLRQHKLPFKVIEKPQADLYVDDLGLRFESWPEVRKIIRAS